MHGVRTPRTMFRIPQPAPSGLASSGVAKRLAIHHFPRRREPHLHVSAVDNTAGHKADCAITQKPAMSCDIAGSSLPWFLVKLLLRTAAPAASNPLADLEAHGRAAQRRLGFGDALALASLVQRRLGAITCRRSALQVDLLGPLR